MRLTNKKREAGIFLCSLLLLLVVTAAAAETLPEGPTNITVINSTRRSAAAAASVSASAGNVTQINLDGTTVTQTWQGYYGNITGTITLDDSTNNTLYDWNLANPKGEIYASTSSSIDFSQDNIICYNFSSDVPAAYTSLSEFETSLGLDSADVDGVNETFLEYQNHSSFYTGTNFVNGSMGANCPNVRLYNSTEESTEGLFEEILLYDLANHEVLYTSIIEDDEIGFTNYSMDFQMIVGEDGHSGDNNPTTYYFYIELE